MAVDIKVSTEVRSASRNAGSTSDSISVPQQKRRMLRSTVLRAHGYNKRDTHFVCLTYREGCVARQAQRAEGGSQAYPRAYLPTAISLTLPLASVALVPHSILPSINISKKGRERGSRLAHYCIHEKENRR